MRKFYFSSYRHYDSGPYSGDSTGQQITPMRCIKRPDLFGRQTNIVCLCIVLYSHRLFPDRLKGRFHEPTKVCNVQPATNFVWSLEVKDQYRPINQNWRRVGGRPNFGRWVSSATDQGFLVNFTVLCNDQFICSSQWSAPLSLRFRLVVDLDHHVIKSMNPIVYLSVNHGRCAQRYCSDYCCHYRLR